MVLVSTVITFKHIVISEIIDLMILIFVYFCNFNLGLLLALNKLLYLNYVFVYAGQILIV